MIAQGKRAGEAVTRAPPWVRGPARLAPLPRESCVRLCSPLPARGRGVGEWGLNNCPEPDPATPCVQHTDLGVKTTPTWETAGSGADASLLHELPKLSSGEDLQYARTPSARPLAPNPHALVRGEPRSMVRIADSVSRGKRPWRSRCRWLGLKRLRALRRAARFR